MTRIKRCALAAALAAAATLPLSAQAAMSTFDTGNEGWTAIGDPLNGLEWSATGGNPGGRIIITDAQQGPINFFSAPAAFLGNQSAALGTFLTFDLRQDYPGNPQQLNRTDVELRGAGLVLALDAGANPPNGGWSSYSVLLEAGNWKLDTLTGATADAAQFASVLADLTALKIRAEYQNLDDAGSLDNVYLNTAVVPLPAPILMLLGGLGLLGWTARRRG